jgi:transcriptional regulator with XRE-family HTH domain
MTKKAPEHAAKDKNTPLTISQRIKQVRLTLEMTQASFSRVLSLSSGYLAGVETEKRKVNDRLIKLLCASFSVNEEWLRAGKGEIFIKEEDELFSKMTSLFKELDQDYRQYIYKQIELLLRIQDKNVKKRP